LLASTHAPLPLLDFPGGQTAHGSFRHRTGRLNSALRTGFLKGCRREEKNPFFSGAAFSLVDGNLADGDRRDAAAPVLAICEAELLELWLLAELADELEPPE